MYHVPEEPDVGDKEKCLRSGRPCFYSQPSRYLKTSVWLEWKPRKNRSLLYQALYDQVDRRFLALKIYLKNEKLSLKLEDTLPSWEEVVNHLLET